MSRRKRLPGNDTDRKSVADAAILGEKTGKLKLADHPYWIILSLLFAVLIAPLLVEGVKSGGGTLWQWFNQPSLEFVTRETILKGDRTIEVNIHNKGQSPAKEVRIVVGLPLPGFSFNQKIHVHTNPNTAPEISIKDNQVEIKLQSPIRKNELIHILIDKLNCEYTPLFGATVGVYSGGGNAEHFDRQQEDLHGKTLDELTKSGYYDDAFRKIVFPE